jgi:hypothetical protein
VSRLKTPIYVRIRVGRRFPGLLYDIRAPCIGDVRAHVAMHRHAESLGCHSCALSRQRSGTQPEHSAPVVGNSAPVVWADTHFSFPAPVFWADTDFSCPPGLTSMIRRRCPCLRGPPGHGAREPPRPSAAPQSPGSPLAPLAGPRVPCAHRHSTRLYAAMHVRLMFAWARSLVRPSTRDSNPPGPPSGSGPPATVPWHVRMPPALSASRQSPTRHPGHPLCRCCAVRGRRRCNAYRRVLTSES